MSEEQRSCRSLPAGCVRVTCSRFVSRSLCQSRPSTLGLVALATVAVSSTSLAGVHPGWGAWETGLWVCVLGSGRRRLGKRDGS